MAPCRFTQIFSGKVLLNSLQSTLFSRITNIHIQSIILVRFRDLSNIAMIHESIYLLLIFIYQINFFAKILLLTGKKVNIL